MLKKYDAVVIGSGCGMVVVEAALENGLSVALVDKGPLGGTCPNTGCIPSKMLIITADRTMEAQEAKKLGVSTQITNIEFGSIMERMRNSVLENQQHMKQGIVEEKDIAFYEGEGRFVDDRTVEVNGETIVGNKVFIASGSRPLVPPIKGLDTVEYLDNESLLNLKERPDSLIIIGGGYIAVEYGHFFAAVGTEVTILEMADRLILSEEPEIAEVLRKELSKRMSIHTGIQVEEVKSSPNGVIVFGKDLKNGGTKQFKAQKILVASGRMSNADLLKLQNTGVETDQKGYIKINEYLETTRKKIYAIGDADGQQMFRHVANVEALFAAHNAFHGSKMKMDYGAAPHAVYSHPQIASVGLTEEAAKKTHRILVGRAKYSDVAYGDAMMETNGFAKAIVEANTSKILGFHIVGPYAPILIQEVINAMTAFANIEEIQASMHIHPALPELIPAVLGNLESV